MQILYLLVLGDKSNVLYGKDLCFNANYRFKHEIIDGDKVKVSWEIKDILPDNFFTTRENNKNCCIDNVSEIIGINGSGKTLIFKSLVSIIINHFSGEYILIYKKNKKVIGRYVLYGGHGHGIFLENDISKDNVYFFPKSLINEKDNFDYYNSIKDEKGYFNYRLNLGTDQDLGTDLVYLCNHYCTSWETLDIFFEDKYLKKSNYFDYSTAGLIFRDSSFYYNKIRGLTIQPFTTLISHRIKEMERIFKLLNFLQKTREKNISKTNINDYKKSINNIIIQKVYIKWNNEFFPKAHDIAQELMSNANHYNYKFSKTLSDISSLFADGGRPYWRSDFFFLTFLCFIASKLIENQYLIKFGDGSIPRMLYEYIILANQLIENKVHDKINEYDIILNRIQEYEHEDGDESDSVYLFFSELLKEFNRQKDTNSHLEFDFSNNESKESLFKIIDLYFKLPKQYSFIDFNFQPSLSSGELSFLTLWARLYDYLENNSKSKHAIIFIDEAETTLHPEWQKALCQSTISFIEDYCEVRKRKLHLHIIFASHSPMLMSDVPTGNVIFLDKDNSSDNLNKTDWKTFAGDIFEIYQKGFFLKNGSIGNFALSKVDSVIQHISQGNISDDDRKIIDMIGDGLITNYFHRIIDNQSSSSNDSQK